MSILVYTLYNFLYIFMKALLETHLYLMFFFFIRYLDRTFTLLFILKILLYLLQNIIS